MLFVKSGDTIPFVKSLRSFYTGLNSQMKRLFSVRRLTPGGMFVTFPASLSHTTLPLSPSLPLSLSPPLRLSLSLSLSLTQISLPLSLSLSPSFSHTHSLVLARALSRHEEGCGLLGTWARPEEPTARFCFRVHEPPSVCPSIRPICTAPPSVCPFIRPIFTTSP